MHCSVDGDPELTFGTFLPRSTNDGVFASLVKCTERISTPSKILFETFPVQNLARSAFSELVCAIEPESSGVLA